MRRLVEDLMEISRLDASGETLHREPVDLAALVAATVRSRGWEQRSHRGRRTRRVVTDPRRLERIVANLVGNAVEHGGGDGPVGSAADRTIEVSDDGPGHPGRATSRMSSSASTRPTGPGAAGGSGLGLAIALENARLLGCERSRPGARRAAARASRCGFL